MIIILMILMARQTRNFFPNIINASHIEKIESYIKKETFDKVPMVSSAINDKFDEGLLRGVIIFRVFWTRKI